MRRGEKEDKKEEEEKKGKGVQLLDNSVAESRVA